VSTFFKIILTLIAIFVAYTLFSTIHNMVDGDHNICLEVESDNLETLESRLAKVELMIKDVFMHSEHAEKIVSSLEVDDSFIKDTETLHFFVIDKDRFKIHAPFTSSLTSTETEEYLEVDYSINGFNLNWTSPKSLTSNSQGGEYTLLDYSFNMVNKELVTMQKSVNAENFEKKTWQCININISDTFTKMLWNAVWGGEEFFNTEETKEK